jgi:hypothetical protein
VAVRTTLTGAGANGSGRTTLVRTTSHDNIMSSTAMTQPAAMDALAAHPSGGPHLGRMLSGDPVTDRVDRWDVGNELIHNGVNTARAARASDQQRDRRDNRSSTIYLPRNGHFKSRDRFPCLAPMQLTLGISALKCFTRDECDKSEPALTSPMYHLARSRGGPCVYRPSQRV